MYEADAAVSAIALELGLHRRIVDKWIRLDALPERNRMTPKNSTPARFHSFLERRWAEGFRNVRGLLREVQVLGYTLLQASRFSLCMEKADQGEEPFV
jgi:hypothetical protein